MKKLILLLFVLALSGIIAWSVQAIPPSPPAPDEVATASDCSTYTALGQLCQDTDDNKVYVGTGSGTQEILSTATAIPDTHTKTGPSCFDAASGGNLGDCANLQDVAYEAKLTCTTSQIKKWGESGWACSSVTAASAAGVMKTDGFCLSLGNGSDAITAGAYYSKAVRIPFKSTLAKVILTTSKTTATALTIDVWIDAPGATTGLANITDADSIFESEGTEPAIANASADNYVEVTTFDTGEDAIAAGDWIVINADGSPTMVEASVCFELTRAD